MAMNWLTVDMNPRSSLFTFPHPLLSLSGAYLRLLSLVHRIQLSQRLFPSPSLGPRLTPPTHSSCFPLL